MSSGKSAIVTIAIIGLLSIFSAACGQTSGQTVISQVASVLTDGPSDQDAIQQIIEQNNKFSIQWNSSTRVAKVLILNKETKGIECSIRVEVTFVENGQLRKGLMGARDYQFVKEDGRWILRE